MATRKRPPRVDVLHVDSDIVVVDKPASVLTVPGRSNAVTVADLLRDESQLADNRALRVVHRLDADASGVLVFARTLAAQRSLVQQFVERRVDKRYWALVTGYVKADGEVNARLVYDRRRNRVRTSDTRGSAALTRYRVFERLAGNTLVECELITGRTHQIRAHMQYIGHPLTIDPVYGGGQSVFLSHYKADYRERRNRPERPLIDRLTLHSRRISFEHPSTGGAVTFEVDVPKDMRATIRQLRFALERK